jgi:AraC-like DNA-binding protein
MSEAHNVILDTHWTNPPDEILLTKTCFSGDKEQMYPQPTEKKAAQSEGLHSVALERHYSVSDVAALWAISEKTVRRIFESEDGVLRWGSSETTRKRAYQTLRIPESVLIRVHRLRTRA